MIHFLRFLRAVFGATISNAIEGFMFLIGPLAGIFVILWVLGRATGWLFEIAPPMGEPVHLAWVALGALPVCVGGALLSALMMIVVSCQSLSNWLRKKWDETK